MTVGTILTTVSISSAVVSAVTAGANKAWGEKQRQQQFETEMKEMRTEFEDRFGNMDRFASEGEDQ